MIRLFGHRKWPLVLGLGLIAAATLGPGQKADPAPDIVGLVPDLNSPFSIEPFLNVLLFVPLGFVVAGRGMRPLVVLAIGVAISGLVEALQLFVPGRDATFRDISANGAGVIVGVALHSAVSWLKDHRSAAPQVLAIAAIGVWTALYLLSGVVWRPSIGAAPAKLLTFTGEPNASPRVPLAGTIGTRSGGFALDSAAVSRLLESGSGTVAFSARIVGDENPTAVVADARGREMLVLQVDGDNLVLRARVIARDIGLLQRSLRMEGAVRGERPLELQGRIDVDDGWYVRIQEPAPRSAHARWDMADLWALFYPAGRVDHRLKARVGWLLTWLLAVPAGLAAGCTRHAGGWWTALALWYSVALLAGPHAVGMPRVDSEIWIATAAGHVGGGIGSLFVLVLGRRRARGSTLALVQRP